eukprot:TRINITY_DN2633_c0_g1_i1.p1 TRINITY_DN2633_c0_g1~~TRINITY_DN2633_c0_g1_i1.p1  ORF type:complete len:426 (+),score=108.84 TRINITY_DN2633_c0_g1_i1:77-1354(+)
MYRIAKLIALAAPIGASAVCPGSIHGTPPSNKAEAPTEAEYEVALKKLDLGAVVADLQHLFTDSQECWPSDFGNYGPLFIRLSWHCSGSYRKTDGAGGCGGGRQRFEPERSWDDNTNLDKARALLWPIKEKYGDGLSWGDLFILAGTSAIKTMGGPITEYCAGRIDSADGTDSLVLGPTPEQEKVAPCKVQGHCEKPLGSTTIGLIYLNPEGPVVQDEKGNWNPDPNPAASARDVRDAFGRMGMNDTQTVALIGGGHAFGKAHGACPSGPGPRPSEDVINPWPGKCGTGKGKDTFTSGFEGPWTTKPTEWDNEYFTILRNSTWEKIRGPGGHWQWRIKDATGPLAGLMRLTSDVALLHDESYVRIVKEFSENQKAFDIAFDEAWFKLTTSGGKWSKAKKCIPGSSIPSLPKQIIEMRGDDAMMVI